jgi:transcriptional regulator with XRE-family HTH domain
MPGKLTEAAKGRQRLSSGAGRDGRVRLGLSLATVAKKLNVTPTALWLWEAGRPLTDDHAAQYERLFARLEREVAS